VERARKFIRANYDNGTYTSAERKLAFACYLAGLVDKEAENSFHLSWQEDGEKNIFAFNGEAVIVKCDYNGEDRYEIGHYHADGIYTSTVLYEGLKKVWSMIPAKGWMPAPKKMPEDVKVAVVRFIGGIDNHLYKVIDSESYWTLEAWTMENWKNVEYLKIA
jgi:hypothetical protein